MRTSISSSPCNVRSSLYFFFLYLSVGNTKAPPPLLRSYNVPNIILYYNIMYTIICLTCVYAKTDNTYDLACRNSSYNVRYSLLYSRLQTKTRFIWSNNYSHYVNIVISNKPLVIIIFLWFPYT